jgi:hypothetical protein
MCSILQVIASQSSLGFISQGPCGIHVAPYHTYHPESLKSQCSQHSYIYGGDPYTIKSNGISSSSLRNTPNDNSTFGALTLSDPFYLSMYETSRSPKIPKCHNISTILHLKYSGVSKSWTPRVSFSSPTTLAMWAHDPKRYFKDYG